MASFIQQAVNQGLAHPPAFLPSNVQYEAIMGSRAYGVNSEDSDYDIYGFAIPPKEVLFPHLAGIIPGFGHQGSKFDQWEQKRIYLEKRGKKIETGFDIYNIVKYFNLCMENNPNMVDSLFVPENCVVHCTQVGQLVRDNRRIFLSKQCWPRFKGYAFAQLHKLDNKKPEGKRKELVDKFGYDVKFAYNIVRLIDECEQILALGDLDLQRANEQMKAIRRGDWSEQQVRDYFKTKLPHLEDVYRNSKLPEVPDEAAIKDLLMRCLEIHYGSLSNCVVNPDAAILALRDIYNILDRNREVIWKSKSSQE